MEDDEKHIDYILIGKYLSGNASRKEIHLVETWSNSSKENQAEYKRLRQLWEESDTLISTSPAPVNTKNAWNKLQQRIAEDENQELPDHKKSHATKTRNLFYYIQRVAAVLLLGVVIYSMYTLFQGPPEQLEVLSENTIKETSLPDRTKITLNEQSTISYPERFTSDKREVSLKGEAFFEVKPIKKKPFIIYAHNAVVRVLGTSFNVRAIEHEPEIIVTVAEGKVRLSDEDDIAYLILEKDEKGIFNRKTEHIEKYELTDGSDAFWKTKTLMFRETDLSTVFETLENVFDAEIEITDNEILSCRLTGKFQDMAVEDILEKIALNFNLTIIRNNNTFEISGNGC